MAQVLQSYFCRINPDRREMRAAALLLLSRIVFFFFFYSHQSSAILGAVASVSTRGVHPLDEKYYWESELIECKDKSKTFTRDRLNDNFCDCIDGSDEPGTSACPRGRFYCRNVGSIPRYLFSSRVNDHICDCCDGSDEYDGSINCPNTCVMGGNLIYKSDTHHYTRSKSLHRASAGVRQIKSSLIPEGVIPKELMLAAMIQWIFLAVLLIVFLSLLCCRCNKPRRRHYH